MPAKPKHRKGRLSPQARRRREEMRGPTTATETAAAPPAQAAYAQAPAAQPSAARPAARQAKAAAAPGALQMMSHQQVGSELRTIGIITAVLVIVLVVLSFVIH